MTQQDKVKSVIESVMVATKERCVTIDELANPCNQTTSVIMARVVFYRLVRDLKILYDSQTAMLMNLEGIRELKMMYGYPLGHSEFMWYNRAMLHYQLLTEKKLG